MKKASQADRQTDWTIHRAAWSQLKNIHSTYISNAWNNFTVNIVPRFQVKWKWVFILNPSYYLRCLRCDKWGSNTCCWVVDKSFSAHSLLYVCLWSYFILCRTSIILACCKAWFLPIVDTIDIVLRRAVFIQWMKYDVFHIVHHVTIG